MNIYEKETPSSLVRILDMMVQDKANMAALGYHKIVEQDNQVINAIMAEINRRGEEK